jgi:hypothetical protein
MNLSDYPRPPADNGRGVHWSPSQYQWGKKDWLKWQERILEMGLKWIKVNVPPDYNAEAIVKRLVDIEVMPVCRFIRKNPTRIGGAIEKTIEQLVALGARYFETNNEPDADVEWEGYHRPPGWEQIVIENLIYDANRVYSIGGFAAFVAFNCGPTEARNPIQILLQTPGGREIFDKGLWVSLHNYGKGRPFNYPNDRVRMFGDPVTEEEWLNQGQPDFWSDAETVEFVWHNATREEVNNLRQEQKNPQISIMTDITGFRAYEYWNTLITQEGLPAIPIMMTEGGWETGDRLDPFYPEPTARRASELNLKMFHFIQGDIEMTVNQPDESVESSPAPNYLFALMPWHIGEKEFGLDTSGQWEQGAWFTHWHDQKFGLNGELPIIQLLRNLPSKVRADGPVPPEWDMRKDLIPEDPPPEWDHRFLYLGDGIRLERSSAKGTKWRVTSGLWQDKDEVNEEPLPPGYIMVKVLDAKGDPIENASVQISRSDASDTILTKGRFDRYMGNYRMTGTLGTYTLQVTYQNYPSDKIYNLGLGGEAPRSSFDQTSFFFTFQLANVPQTSPSPATSEETASNPRPPEESEQPTTPGAASHPADNDAAEMGVKIHPLGSRAVARVKKIHHYTSSEQMGRSTLYLDVVDVTGKRIYGAVALVEDAAGRALRIPIEKPLSEPGGNAPMWPHNLYRLTGVEIQGNRIPAQRVSGLRSLIPGKGGGHSFLVIIQISEE